MRFTALPPTMSAMCNRRRSTVQAQTSLFFASVAGTIFNDANNSGVQVSGETGLSNWTVYLTPTGTTSGTQLATTTAADGSYSFAGMAPGTHTPSPKPCRAATPTVPVGGSMNVTITAGQASAGPVFGDALISTVTLNFNMLVALSQDYNKPGTFANCDLNGDGIANFDDLVLLSQNYNLTLPAGDYNFSTMTASSLALTSSSAQTTALPAPSSTAKAAAALASISGTVFNVNGDSVRQSGDKELSGRTVELEIAGKGTKGVRTTVTNSSGDFSFTNLPAGNYVLIVPAPAGWKSTTAVASGDLLALQAGTKKSGLLFGQQIIPPYTVTATRVIDPLDHTKDIGLPYVCNNGVCGHRRDGDVLAVDATLSSPRRDCSFAQDTATDRDRSMTRILPAKTRRRPRVIFVLADRFFVASTTPAARTHKYKDMQLVPSFEWPDALRRRRDCKFGGRNANRRGGGEKGRRGQVERQDRRREGTGGSCFDYVHIVSRISVAHAAGFSIDGDFLIEPNRPRTAFVGKRDGRKSVPPEVLGLKSPRPQFIRRRVRALPLPPPSACRCHIGPVHWWNTQTAPRACRRSSWPAPRLGQRLIPRLGLDHRELLVAVDEHVIRGSVACPPPAETLQPPQRDRMFSQNLRPLDNTPSRRLERGVDVLGSGFGFVHSHPSVVKSHHHRPLPPRPAAPRLVTTVRPGTEWPFCDTTSISGRSHFNFTRSKSLMTVAFGFHRFPICSSSS